MPDQVRITIRRFWSTANEWQWDQFAALLHLELLYRVPQTRECVRSRDGFVDFFRTWPGEWKAEITQLIADAHSAVSTITFLTEGEAMTGISFFELRDGLIYRITDYWPSPYEPAARATPYVERY
jgi:hypothetical protein